jgi:hypothetical protein
MCVSPERPIESDSKLKPMGDFAFHPCASLERLDFGGPPPTFGRSFFGECERLREVLF